MYCVGIDVGNPMILYSRKVSVRLSVVTTGLMRESFSVQANHVQAEPFDAIPPRSR